MVRVQIASPGRARQNQRPTAGARPRGGTERWTWVAFACVLVAGAVYLLWLGRGNTFFYDEWTWILTRRDGLHAVLASYNAHLLAFPIAVYQVLFHTVGLAHYSFYRALATVAHLLCAATVFEFARRRLGALALLVAVPIVFLGKGWEFPLEGVNFGFTASIACGIGALLALERHDRRGDVLACGLLLVGLACSEFCALFALGVAAETYLTDRSVRRLWIGAVPLAAYGIWWLAYYQPYLSAGHDLEAVPRFAADLASAAAGGLLGRGPRAGRIVLLVAAALVLWRIVRDDAWSPRLAGLLLTTLGFWLIVAAGRAQLGAPASPRYVYTGAVMLVLILSENFRGARVGVTSVAALAALSVIALIGNLNALRAGQRDLAGAARTLKAELGALELSRAVAPPGLVLDPQLAPQIVAGQYFAAVRDLGRPKIDAPKQLEASPEDVRLAADSVLTRAGEVRLRPAVRAASRGPAPALEAVFGGRVSVRGACLVFDPAPAGSALDVRLNRGGLAVGTRARAPVQVRLRRFASGFPAGAFASAGGRFAVQAAPDAWTAPWHLRISTRQPVRLCAAA